MTQAHKGVVVIPETPADEQRPHRCNAWISNPSIAYPIGMVWRCECGKAWKCWSRLGQRGWRRYRKADDR